jgi:hypothetical protein
MPQVESYFKAQGTLRSPYYIGLRSFAAGGISPYTGFSWQDGSGARPPDVPSDSVGNLINYNTYAHFGGNGSTTEPNNSTSPDANCMVADETCFSPYWYYGGTNTTSDLQDLDSYVDSANATLNLWAWRRVSGWAAAGSGYKAELYQGQQRRNTRCCWC